MPSPSRTTQLALFAAVIALAGVLVWQTRRASQAIEAANAAGVARRSTETHLATSDERANDPNVVSASLLETLDLLTVELQATAAPEFTQESIPPAADRDDSRGEGRNWGDRDRDRFGHGPRQMSAELITRCVEIAGEVDITLGQQLSEARQKDPAEFDRQMKQGGFGRRLASLVELKQRDPDLYKIKLGELSQAVQIDRAAKQLRDAKKAGSQGEIDMYEGQLRRLLQVQFAMSIKARAELLCRLEDRIAELRAEMERDALHFQSIIDARMKLLAGDSNAGKAAPASGAPAAAPVGQVDEKSAQQPNTR